LTEKAKMNYLSDDLTAPYPSGKGEVCKTFMQRFESARRLYPAQVVELVDTRDLKSLGQYCPCRFKSGLGHITTDYIRGYSPVKDYWKTSIFQKFSNVR
jgi:hypothetical protein